MVLQAIEEVGDRGAHPRDYLNFFMLAKCEKRLPDEPQPEKKPKKGSPAAKAQQHRRSPVYVHSKTLVIDDEVRSLVCEGPPAPRTRSSCNKSRMLFNTAHRVLCCLLGHAALRRHLIHAPFGY